MSTRLLVRSVFFVLLASPVLPLGAQDLFSVRKSEVTFVSDAPMERITATATNSAGVLDIRQRTFVVRVPVAEFEGFNSPLQREHFNENYLESRRFPQAQFDGRIIETVDLTKAGTHAVRAKGRFTLHGVSTERIIPCTITVAEGGIRIKSVFDVPLADHDIRIPRVVQQKIAAVVSVSIDLLLERRKP